MKPDSGKRKKMEKGEGDGGQLVDRDYNGRRTRAHGRSG
jgi:hypothetical protein